MVDRGLLPRVRLSSRSMPPCSACLTGTINAHAAVSTHHHRATRPLERLYLDFFIPAQENIIPDRAAAVLYIVDEATRFLWTHVAESRTAAMSWFRAQVAHWERRCRQRVVEIVTDCAPEFLATNFRDWASNLGIDQLYSVAHEPIHNGAVQFRHSPAARDSFFSMAFCLLDFGRRRFLMRFGSTTVSHMLAWTVFFHPSQPCSNNQHACITLGVLAVLRLLNFGRALQS